MEAFDPVDLAAIRTKTIRVFGTAAAFNFAMRVVSNAILTGYGQQVPESTPMEVGARTSCGDDRRSSVA
jgi:hypothetical protein